MRSWDGAWIPKDEYQWNENRTPDAASYTHRRFEGFVDLMKTGSSACPVEEKVLGNLYMKFKDENGLTNYISRIRRHGSSIGGVFTLDAI